MGQANDVEDSIYNRHQDLCQKLNMDANAASEAWKSYSTIRENYTLEGDQMHWIGCAVYVACRESSTPTVGRTGSNVQGNCVSLKRLLKLCNLSLIQFFTKCKSWADMANIPPTFRSKIDKLECNFSVSMIIFKKYQPIFTDIFRNPTDDNSSKPLKSRRSKLVPCTTSKVFEFCWTLFICVKGAFPDITDDLVNSYHLLIACCDLVYSNALLSNRKDLLNPDFPGLPSDFNDENFEPPLIANCIINLLCERHEAIAVEAKVIKEYSLKKHVNKLFNERILRGDQSNFSGILEALNFDGNLKALNKSYEEHVLSVGDFDERIFLGADANDSIGSPPKMLNVGELAEQFTLKREQIRDFAPSTPLTGRKYLKSKDNLSITAVFTATQSVSRLQALLAGRTIDPSEKLVEMFASCSTEIAVGVENKVRKLGEMFCSSYTQNSDENDTNNLDFGKKRLGMGQTLFYKILEIILIEEKRIKPDYDITSLLTNEIFLQCLFACCLEIVIWSYKNKDRTFPWILKALKVEPYNFYKVIEVIVRAEQLSRDIVKHLNVIEEKILECLAWESDSPLWQAIKNTPGGVPSCEEVSLPDSVDPNPNAPGQPALRKIALDRGQHYDVPQSPISSASERFHSPVSSGWVKKRLFNDSKSGLSVLKEQYPPKIAIDQSSAFLIISDQSQKPLTASMPPLSNIVKSKKTGSVALFFRKFYILGSIRMQNLCESLAVTETELKKKIWTIFEYSIKSRTELMKDRHLDQLLMCAVYVVCKLARIERNTFTEIMRCYRFQPQAESHIYRSVLISKNRNERNENDVNNDSRLSILDTNNTMLPPTPSNMAGTSRNFGNETRGDLIKFYNTVYVPHVKDVAILSRGNNSNLTLSPLLKSKPTINSPVRHVTSSVMTRQFDPKSTPASPAPQLTYCFSRSPAKALEAINKMVISVDVRKSVGKRLMSDEMDVDQTDSTTPTKKSLVTPYLARKIENVIGDRRTQNQ